MVLKVNRVSIGTITVVVAVNLTGIVYRYSFEFDVLSITEMIKR